jgi:hypothetical protein
MAFPGIGKADRLNQQFEQLYARGTYSEAKGLARQALTIREALLGERHLRGERPVKKGPGNDYGPIESPPAPVVSIVVLSDRRERGELSRTIRASLPSEPRDLEAHDQTWRDDVCARLVRGGHRWVSVERIRVVPAKPDPAERPPRLLSPGDRRSDSLKEPDRA